MKHLLLIICFLFAIVTLSVGQTIYVKIDGKGNGQSWETATGSLARALKVATPGTEIWVASGTYFPSLCKHCTKADRAMYFKIPSGVKVYGGFAGHETSTRNRNPKRNTTMLSGQIGADETFDNSQTIVYFENVSDKTLLDGFTIHGGLADNKSGGDGHASRSGAGIYNIATEEAQKSIPLIKNCLIYENNAAEGGAIFNFSDGGIAAVKMVNCVFLKNTSENAGGAVMDNAQNGKASSHFEHCTFVNNHSKFGGAYFSSNATMSEEIFTHCKFISNISEYGAAGFLSSEEESSNKFFSKSCSFDNNHSKDGKKFYVQQKNNLNDSVQDLMRSNGTSL